MLRFGGSSNGEESTGKGGARSLKEMTGLEVI